MPDLHTIYSRLPWRFKNVAASVRGYHLKSQRYGTDTDRLVSEAHGRDEWSEDEWRLWTQERLAYLLHRAATTVPYYQRQWTERRREGDRSSWDVLSNWPLLTKETVRRNPKDFLSCNSRDRSLHRLYTSGTTGTPLALYRSRETMRAWYALSEARYRKWYGVDRHDRWAIWGGRLVVSAERKQPPFWVWNAGLNQLYLSSYHISPDTVPAYLAALRSHEVRYLIAYPSAMYVAAKTMLDQGLESLKLRVVISNAEPLYDHQRLAIQEAFQCPVRDTYGSTEIIAAASECDYGKMHLWPDAGIIEVLDDFGTEPLADGDVGRFVGTGLINDDMPLIRYAIGDRGRIASEYTRCRCGRRLPVILEIQGRLDDVILLRDGRRIGRLDPVFKADMGVREVQVIQETLDHFLVRYIPAENFSPHKAGEIARRLAERLGDVYIELEAVNDLPRTSNGKLRSVISNVENA